MAFPIDPIQIRVELALGANPDGHPSTWDWTDVTQWVRRAGSITISRGRPDEFGTIAPASCSLTVDNGDGRWVSRNPRGAWFTQIRKGVPLRVSVNPGDGWHVRFTGFIDALPVRQDASGRNRYVPLTASGMLKRLSRPKAARRSAAYRWAVLQDTARAYIPLEDGDGAQRGASGLSRQPDAQAFGGYPLPRWGAVTGPAGSGNLPDVSDRRALTGLITDWGDDDDQWSVSCWIQGASASGGTTCSPVQWQTDGSAGYWALLARWPGDGSGTPTPAGSLRIWVLAMAPAPGQSNALAGITNEVTIDSADNDWHHVRVVATDSAGSLVVDLYVDGELVDSSSAAGYIPGRPVRYHINPTIQGAAYLDVDGIGINSVGHLLFETVGSGGGGYAAGLGHPGLAAGTRVWSTAFEAGIPITPSPIIGGVALGPEPTGTELDVMRDAAVTDNGLLYELVDGELTYVLGEDRYNRAVDLSLDWAQRQVGQPFEPTDDDQQLRNAVTASRRTGTSATYEDEDHIELYGRYEDGVQVNPATDSALLDHAAWRVRLGTVDELRVPTLSLNLAHPQAAALVVDWLACDIGARVTVDNIPQDYSTDGLDVLIEGYTETIQRPRVWTVQMNCSPASPYTVAVVEDPILGRLDTDGSRWVSSVAVGTDTSELVLVTAGQPWINSADHAAMFPVDVRSLGVVLSVTGIAAAAADSFSRTVGAGGWGTATTGQSWSINSGVAANWSVVGGTTGRVATATVNQLELATIDVGTPDADPRCEMVLPVVPTGAGFTLRVFARYTDTSNYYQAELLITTAGVPELRLYKRVAGTATQLGSTITLSPLHTAGDRWLLQCSAVDDTIRARAWKSGQPEARGWHITATDTALTSGTRVGVGVRRETSNTNGSTNVDVDNFQAPSLQTFTISTTPVNGVVGTIPAGTPLSLADPMRLSL